MITEYESIAERDWLAIVPVGKGTLIVSLAAPELDRETFEPTFLAMLASVHFPLESPPGEPAVSPVYVEPSKILVRDTISVNAGQAVHYTFGLERGTKLAAEFQVAGGLNDKIEVYLLDSENYQRYVAGQQFSVFRGTSGTIRGLGKYEFNVPQTSLFYIVIDNGQAWLLPRQVTLHLYAVLPHSTPESLQQQRAFQSAYQALKQLFIFPDFRISIQHCGVENAFSNPNITLCMELMDAIAQKGLPSAIGFVFFHELGHTLLRGWGLPLWDNEDAADEFATVFMILTRKQTDALQAAQWWAAEDVRTEDAVAKIWMDDRHSLSPQRARNIIHWLNDEQELVARWQKLFVPNMQTEALRSLLQDARAPLDRDLVRSELSRRGAQSGDN